MTIFIGFFSLFSLQRKIHRLDCFHGNGPYFKTLTEREPSRAQEFANLLRLGLPYNIQLSPEGEVNSGGYIPRREASRFISTALHRP